VKLPKLGWQRMRQSQPVPGVLKNASVTTERGKWFVSLQVELPDVLPSTDLLLTLGIDLGLALFAAMSDGRTAEPLGALKKQQRRLRHAQRSVSRKVKGSRNRRKAVDRLGRLHARIAAQRNDWLHKLSTELADQHPVIAIEDLKVAAMAASAAGTAAAPGQRVRQKAGLNRAILDQGWAEFRRQLEYKTAARGGAIVAVNPAYTSQTCSCCCGVAAGNRRTQAFFACLACGHTENADVNAAKNILAAGRAVWATGPAACGAAVRARKGKVRSRDEAGTHRGDSGCSSWSAVGIPAPLGLGGRQHRRNRAWLGGRQRNYGTSAQNGTASSMSSSPVSELGRRGAAWNSAA
jgi:putative transposase